MINAFFAKDFLNNLRGRVGRKIEKRGIPYFVFFAVKKALMAIVVCLVYVCVRLIRPVILIRFGSLNADKIGPLISRPGLYLCEKDHDIQPQGTLDIFHDGCGHNRHICNQQLLKMWKRVFSDRERVFLSQRLAKWFFDFFKEKSFAQQHIIETPKHGRDVKGLIEESDIYLKFTGEEISQAESGMRRMGIKKDSPYVCMLNRDQRYLNDTFPIRSWGYQSFRNCSIKNYMPAAEELTRRGFYVIRMGAVVGERMDTDNPKIIDYAARGFRTELLDIYLPAHCYFFIGCNSGLDAVPWFFHRPEVYVNISDLEFIHTWLSHSVMIFKRYWMKKEKKFMTVSEIINSGAGRFNYTEEYEKMGIELVENTSEEILDVVDELDQRLKGIWQTNEEDEGLQKNFWSNFQSSKLHGVIRSRIGTKFLRQNKELLGCLIE